MRRERYISSIWKNSWLGALMVLGLAYAEETHGQQDPMFTQYFFNPLSVNSGYAGTREAMHVALVAREQWVGIDGRPRTQSLVIHSPLKNEKIALGMSFLRDQIGPVQSTGIFGDIAYRIQLTPNSRLAFGLKGGVTLFTADLSSLTGTQENDPSFSQNLQNAPMPNVGAGLYWWSERYFVGLSAPKLIENNLSPGNALEQGSEKRHFFAMAGYVFTLNPTLKFKPTALVKYVQGAPVSAEITTNILIAEKLWLGAMYRYKTAAGALMSYQVTPQLRAGYSFDYTTNDLGRYNTGTHEIMLSYDFVFKSSHSLSPRYF